MAVLFAEELQYLLSLYIRLRGWDPAAALFLQLQSWELCSHVDCCKGQQVRCLCVKAAMLGLAGA